MSIDAVQNKFSLTNQFLREVLSDKCELYSIAAKISLLVFPFILLISILTDMMVWNFSLEKQVVDLTIDLYANDLDLQKGYHLYQLVGKCTDEQRERILASPQLHRIGADFLNRLGFHPEPQDLQIQDNPVASILNYCDYGRHARNN